MSQEEFAEILEELENGGNEYTYRGAEIEIEDMLLGDEEAEISLKAANKFVDYYFGHTTLIQDHLWNYFEEMNLLDNVSLENFMNLLGQPHIRMVDETLFTVSYFHNKLHESMLVTLEVDVTEEGYSLSYVTIDD